MFSLIGLVLIVGPYERIYAQYPKLGHGPDPQFVREPEPQKNKEPLKAPMFAGKSHPMIKSCPGSPRIYSDDCSFAVIERYRNAKK